MSVPVKDMDSKCKDACEYIRFIYEKICFFPKELEVTYKVGDFIHFVIQGNSRDDGVLIGRSGATVQALRLFIHAYSKTNLEAMPCIVEIKDHRGSTYNQNIVKQGVPIYRRHASNKG